MEQSRQTGQAKESAEQTVAVMYSRPFFTPSQINNLATQSEIDSPNGWKFRVRGFELTQRVCKHLNLPMRTFDTAMTLFLHVIINSSAKLAIDGLVGACILLGTKMQDTPKKSRDIAHYLLIELERPNGTKENEDFKSIIAAQEQQILETIAFDFRYQTPHYYTIKLAKELKIGKEPAQTAWDITTDMFLTWSSLRQPPHTLALASIILAAKLHDLKQVFPIDSPAYFSERTCVNECLADVLDLYIDNYQLSALSAGTGPQVSRGIFEGIAQAIKSELKLNNKKSLLEGLLLYDPKISTNGTAEYLLFKP